MLSALHILLVKFLTIKIILPSCETAEKYFLRKRLLKFPSDVVTLKRYNLSKTEDNVNGTVFYKSVFHHNFACDTSKLEQTLHGWSVGLVLAQWVSSLTYFCTL